jgi:hypothetical protein
MKEGGTPGLAYGWNYADDLGSGGSATLAIDEHSIPEKGWLQRFYYTAVAGDSAGFSCLWDLTVIGTFAQNDYVTASIDIKGEVTGCSCWIQIREFDSGGVGAILAASFLHDSVRGRGL